jgi:CelD/BcsL family acetyltransferase involved in cellulose biosynthesis
MPITPSFFSQDLAAIPIPSPLQAVREEWENIYQELPVRSPFLSFDYIRLWYHCFAEAESIRLIRIGNRGETLGFLPMVLTRQSGRRVLRSLSNVHCFHCPPLIRLNREEQFRQQLYSTLRGGQSSWDILELSCFFSFRSDFDIVSQERLVDSSFKNGRYEQPDFTIDLSSTFEEYYHHVLSSKLRGNLKRFRQRLQDSGTTTFKHYQKEDAVENFPEFLQIESSGWKERADSTILSLPENYRRYYQNLVRLLAKPDNLHLFFLELDGLPISGEFGYTEGEVYHSFKSGYREQYRNFTPSNLLFLDIIEYFLKSRSDIKRIHLFPEDGGYKHRWTNEDTTMVNVTLFSASLRGQLSYFTHRARNRLKRISWLRPVVKALQSDR